MCVGCWHFETHGVCTCVYCVRHCLYRHRKSPLGNSSVKLTQCSLVSCMWKCMCMSVCVCVHVYVWECVSVHVVGYGASLVASLIPSKPSKYGVWRMSILYYYPCPRPAALSCVHLRSHGNRLQMNDWTIQWHYHFLLVQEGMTWYPETTVCMYVCMHTCSYVYTYYIDHVYCCLVTPKAVVWSDHVTV